MRVGVYWERGCRGEGLLLPLPAAALGDDEALKELRDRLDPALLGQLVLVGVIALYEGRERLAGQGLEWGGGEMSRDVSSDKNESSL